jgi:hypothetical protein
MAQLGSNLLQQQKWSEAEPVLRECLAICVKARPDDWYTFDTRSVLGAVLAGQKKYAEAEPLIVSGYEGLKAREAKIPPPAKVYLAEAAGRIVPLYQAWGQKEKAAAWREKLAASTQMTRPRTPDRRDRSAPGAGKRTKGED